MVIKPKKVIVRSLGILLIAAIGVLIYYCWISFPLMAGYGVKVMCSAVFDGSRNEEQVRDQDLSAYMMRMADFHVDYVDSSVTGSVFGFGKRKAIYRNGLGATLISELSERNIRSQQYKLPAKPVANTETIPWPMGDKLCDTFPASVDSLKLQSAMKNVFVEEDTILPVRTRAVIVLYDGQLIAERYADGFGAKTKLAGWSMTKTVTGALIGILVKQGKLAVELLPRYRSGSLPPIHDMRSPLRIYYSNAADWILTKYITGQVMRQECCFKDQIWLHSPLHIL